MILVAVKIGILNGANRVSYQYLHLVVAIGIFNVNLLPIFLSCFSSFLRTLFSFFEINNLLVSFVFYVYVHAVMDTIASTYFKSCGFKVKRVAAIRA